MVKLYKPKYWDKKISFFSILLLPVSLLVIFYIYLKKRLTKELNFKIPIICVGNIYIGGTGKTPISILLAKELSKIGKKPVILRKFYKSHKDEYNLIKSKLRNLVISNKRVEGLKNIEKCDYNIDILDDGLKEYF